MTPRHIRRQGRAIRWVSMLVLAACFAVLGPAIAQPGKSDNERPSVDPDTERRLRALSAELRCLVCQNQSLADSNAELALDLRRQVESMIARGDSDTKIKAFLVERYGDFVLYRPPVQGNTALLWFGPFGLLLVGAVTWALVQRRSRHKPRETLADAADAERARRLLDGDPAPGKSGKPL